jgi:hypothetical protein
MLPSHYLQWPCCWYVTSKRVFLEHTIWVVMWHRIEIPSNHFAHISGYWYLHCLTSAQAVLLGSFTFEYPSKHQNHSLLNTSHTSKLQYSKNTDSQHFWKTFIMEKISKKIMQTIHWQCDATNETICKAVSMLKGSVLDKKARWKIHTKCKEFTLALDCKPVQKTHHLSLHFNVEFQKVHWIFQQNCYNYCPLKMIFCCQNVKEISKLYVLSEGGVLLSSWPNFKQWGMFQINLPLVALGAGFKCQEAAIL